jgi:hypothetical protein
MARVCAALYGTIGLIAGIVLALFSTMFGSALAGAEGSGMPAWAGMVFGVGGIIILPIFYAIAGMIGGAIWSALYNLLASIVGGIELTLE